jgi:hypothetical protein
MSNVPLATWPSSAEKSVDTNSSVRPCFSAMAFNSSLSKPVNSPFSWYALGFESLSVPTRSVSAPPASSLPHAASEAAATTAVSAAIRRFIMVRLLGSARAGVSR